VIDARCPRCGGDDIVGEGTDENGPNGTQRVLLRCSTCEQRFHRLAAVRCKRCNTEMYVGIIPTPMDRFSPVKAKGHICPHCHYNQ
jgi:hypothetical protein